MLVKEYPYKLRAHHGLCLSFFSGIGYSNKFVENMTYIKDKLKKNPLVRITSQTDIICCVCPNNKAGICVSEKKIKEYDRQVFLKCNISDGEIMPFLDFERLVQHNILLPGKRKEICQNCEWDLLCHDGCKNPEPINHNT